MFKVGKRNGKFFFFFFIGQQFHKFRLQVIHLSISLALILHRAHSALLLGCGHRLGPSGFAVILLASLIVLLAPPTCLAMLLDPPSKVAVVHTSPMDLVALQDPPRFLLGSWSFQTFNYGSRLAQTAGQVYVMFPCASVHNFVFVHALGPLDPSPLFRLYTPVLYASIITFPFYTCCLVLYVAESLSFVTWVCLLVCAVCFLFVILYLVT